MFVVNPRSAGGRTMKRWKNTEIMLKSERVGGYHVAYTSKVAEATQITREAIKEGYQHIIAVGGDGTINEVLNGFYENGQKIAASSYFSFWLQVMAVIFSVCSRIMIIKRPFFPLSEEKGLSIAIRSGYLHFLDKTGESRYYINTADLGIGAETCMRVNQNSKQLWFSTFSLLPLEHFCSHQNFQAQVLVDGIKFFRFNSGNCCCQWALFWGRNNDRS